MKCCAMPWCDALHFFMCAKLFPHIYSCHYSNRKPYEIPCCHINSTIRLISFISVFGFFFFSLYPSLLLYRIACRLLSCIRRTLFAPIELKERNRDAETNNKSDWLPSKISRFDRARKKKSNINPIILSNKAGWRLL